MSCAGILSGRIVRVDGLHDTTRVPTHVVCMNRFSRHALVCGSTNPHAVSFDGARADHEADATDVPLFSIDGLEAVGDFDDKKRIKTLVVFAGGEAWMRAEWRRRNETGPDHELVLTGCPTGKRDEEEVVVSNADECFSCILPTSSGKEVFARLQSGQVASFAIEEEIEDDAEIASSSGLLHKRLALSSSPLVTNTTPSSYERIMEPHMLLSVAG